VSFDYGISIKPSIAARLFWVVIASSFKKRQNCRFSAISRQMLCLSFHFLFRDRFVPLASCHSDIDFLPSIAEIVLVRLVEIHHTRRLV
jgi:hypothetical protein